MKIKWYKNRFQTIPPVVHPTNRIPLIPKVALNWLDIPIGPKTPFRTSSRSKGLESIPLRLARDLTSFSSVVSTVILNPKKARMVTKRNFFQYRRLSILYYTENHFRWFCAPRDIDIIQSLLSPVASQWVRAHSKTGRSCETWSSAL